MKNVYFWILFLFLMVPALSCSDHMLQYGGVEKAGTTSGGDTENNEEDDSSEIPDEDTLAVAPSVISGAYLACQQSERVATWQFCSIRSRGEKLNISHNSFLVAVDDEEGRSLYLPVYKIRDEFWSFKVILEGKFSGREDSLHLEVMHHGTFYEVGREEKGVSFPEQPQDEEAVAETPSDPVSLTELAERQLEVAAPESENPGAEGAEQQAETGIKLPPPAARQVTYATGLTEGLGDDFNFDLDFTLPGSLEVDNSEHLHEYSKATESNGVDFLNLASKSGRKSVADFMTWKDPFYIIVVNANGANTPYLQINDTIIEARGLAGVWSESGSRPVFSFSGAEQTISLSTFRMAFDSGTLEGNSLLIQREKEDIFEFDDDSDEEDDDDNGYRNGALTIQFVRADSPLMVHSKNGMATSGVLLELIMYRH